MSRLNAILLNPTIDQIYEIENFFVGGTFKVRKNIIYPVGKAISFSLGIRELTKKGNIIKVIACIGKGEISLYSNFLKSRNIDFNFLEINGKTRSNKTINDPIQKTTTHIRERGFELNGEAIKRFIEKIKNSIQNDDIIIISGSLPPLVEDDIYYKIINYCKERNMTTVLDTNGPALIKGIKANPTIIKPNLVELSQLLKEPKLNDLNFSDVIQTSQIISKKAFKLLNKELKIILITLGEKGAIMLTKDKAIYGNVKVENVIDTVGSGDSFLAGFMLNFLEKKDLNECFAQALACGAANTLIPGPGIFKIEDLKKILKNVKIFNLN